MRVFDWQVGIPRLWNCVSATECSDPLCCLYQYQDLPLSFIVYDYDLSVKLLDVSPLNENTFRSSTHASQKLCLLIHGERGIRERIYREKGQNSGNLHADDVHQQYNQQRLHQPSAARQKGPGTSGWRSDTACKIIYKLNAKPNPHLGSAETGTNYRGAVNV